MSVLTQLVFAGILTFRPVEWLMTLEQVFTCLQVEHHGKPHGLDPGGGLGVVGDWLDSREDTILSLMFGLRLEVTRNL